MGLILRCVQVFKLWLLCLCFKKTIIVLTSERSTHAPSLPEEGKLPLDGSGSRIISVIPCQCPSARHQKQEHVRGGTNRRWFDSLSPANGLHIHFIYSSARSQQYGAADGWRRKMTKRKENHCLTLDSGWLLFLAKAAIITRATSNKIVQARLGN